MQHVTEFNTQARYIFLLITLKTKSGEEVELDAILDTGAPLTEFSDETLQKTGYLEKVADLEPKPGFPTLKYGKMTLASMEVCSHKIDRPEVWVSKFDKHWGFDALIGLDFFRQYCVTINYQQGKILSEAYKAAS